ncbi:K(+)-transporting ATPase subunit F, partial [Priestia megaterium]
VLIYLVYVLLNPEQF